LWTPQFFFHRPFDILSRPKQQQQKENKKTNKQKIKIKIKQLHSLPSSFSYPTSIFSDKIY